MTPVISLTGVSRRYGSHDALADVTADIGTPSITGLLGRNGAGKSTLLRILAGQEFATSGRVSVFGASPAENDAVLRRTARPHPGHRPRPAGRVDRFIADRPTLSRRTMGGHATAVMAGRRDERDRELADHLQLRLDRVTLQQLAVYAAGSRDRLDLTEGETTR